MMPHMSARMRTQTMDALFEGAGGFDRALAWIEESSDNYGEFFKIWSKGQARTTNVELGLSDSIEDKLKALDQASNEKVIAGEFTRSSGTEG